MTSATPAALPGSGRGSTFGVVANNVQAAALDLTDDFSVLLSPTNDFTIEVLAHLDTDPGIFGYTFAGFATGGAPDAVGWVLQTRQSTPTSPDRLILTTSLGGSATLHNSGIALVPGKDYAIAAIHDLHGAGVTVTFWVTNLTDGGAPQKAMVENALVSGFNPIGTFVIGDHVHSTTGFDGLIDEVRLSNTALPPSQLLVPVPVFGPLAWVLLSSALVVSGGLLSARAARRA